MTVLLRQKDWESVVDVSASNLEHWDTLGPLRNVQRVAGNFRAATHIQSVKLSTSAFLHGFGQLSRPLISNLKARSKMIQEEEEEEEALRLKLVEFCKNKE